jgi:ParB-like chromosome segregation protein Spo0J
MNYHCPLLALAVLVAGLPAQAAAIEDALGRLAQVQREFAGMRAAASQRLGPYELHPQCMYCASELLGICTAHAVESRRKIVDFSSARGQVDALLAQAERDAGALENDYAPAQAWVAGLPAFSARFDTIADVVLGVEQAIRQGIGPEEQQRRHATQALLHLTGELGRSGKQLDAGIRALAVSREQQIAYRGMIRQAIDGAAQSAQAAWRDLEKGQRCQDDLYAKFGAIQSDFSRATQEIAGAFERLDSSSLEGAKALEGLLGTVNGARAEVESVLRLLAAAGIEQLDSFLGRLHLDVARRRWHELAKSAAP